MLLPALSKAKAKGQSIACLNNLRQLQLCWQLYTDDHGGTMPRNKYSNTPGSSSGLADSWIMGNAQLDASPSNIMNGVLFPYNRSLAIYRCPTDRSTVQGRPQLLRFRSYMLNAYLNGNEYDRRIKTKEAQLLNPAQIFGFIDVSEWTINDGAFVVRWLGAVEGDKVWNDYPSDRHSQGCNLSFVDGHAVHWRWRAPKKNKQPFQPVANDQDLQDLRRLQAAIPDP